VGKERIPHEKGQDQGEQRHGEDCGAVAGHRVLPLKRPVGLNSRIRITRTKPITSW
jgi:hypothetical protein